MHMRIVYSICQLIICSNFTFAYRLPDETNNSNNENWKGFLFSLCLLYWQDARPDSFLYYYPSIRVCWAGKILWFSLWEFVDLFTRCHLIGKLWEFCFTQYQHTHIHENGYMDTQHSQFLRHCTLHKDPHAHIQTFSDFFSIWMKHNLQRLISHNNEVPFLLHFILHIALHYKNTFIDFRLCLHAWKRIWFVFFLCSLSLSL